VQPLLGAALRICKKKETGGARRATVAVVESSSSNSTLRGRGTPTGQAVATGGFIGEQELGGKEKEKG